MTGLFLYIAAINQLVSWPLKIGQSLPAYNYMSFLLKDSGQIADVSALDGIVVLYASGFGNKDAHGDIIAKGAYAKSIKERGPAGTNRIKHLNMHWWDEMLGVPLELIEDEKGLRVVSKIAKTRLGLDALILYKEGVITEHSVGIDVLKRDEQDEAIILETRLWEYSAVTWGANPLTPTVEVKQLPPREKRGQKYADDRPAIPTPLAKQIESASRALNTGGISDETCNQIEHWLDRVKTIGQPQESLPVQKTADKIKQLAILSRLHSINKSIQF